MKKLFILMSVLLCTLPTNAYADLTDGLVAHYRFNGDASDESRNGNNGTVNGATLTNDRFGKANKAYAFDGSSYIDCGNDDSINIAGNLTLSTWVKIDDSSTLLSEQALIGKVGPSHSEPEDNQYMLILEPGSTILFLSYGTHSGQAQPVQWSHPDWPDGNWVHIVTTYDKATDIGSIYFNGVYKTSGSLNGEPNNYTTNINLTLGATPVDTSTRYLVGLLDDVRIYNRVLSLDEVGELYATEDSEPAEVAIEWVTVGDAGNAGELSGGWSTDRICGAVDYVYRMGSTR